MMVMDMAQMWTDAVNNGRVLLVTRDYYDCKEKVSWDCYMQYCCNYDELKATLDFFGSLSFD